MSLKHTKILSIILLVAVFSALGSWIISSRIQSPADIALRSAAPTPSLIFAVVEKRVLVTNIVTRGTARFGLPQTITIAPSPLKSQVGVITEIPKFNTQLKEGAVVLSASGRPLFILQGKIPIYRDLAPGMSGDDVLQLKQGLKRLGFFTGIVNKNYDQKTSLAVTRWYKSKAWKPFGPTSVQLEKLRILEQRWGNVNKRMLEAKSSDVIAELVVERARVTAQYKNNAAMLEVKEQEAAHYLVVLDPRQQKTARAAAKAKLKLAQSAVDKTRLDGMIAIQTAIETRKVTKFTTTLETKLLKKLANELKISRQKLGVQVPVDEIVFVPSLPVRVKEVKVQVGAPARGPMLTVTNNQLIINSSLTLNAAPLVKKGMDVYIDEKALGVSTTGVIKKIANSPGTFGVDGYHIYFEVAVAKTSMQIEGVSLRLTIPVKSSGDAVIVVPINALSLSADGTSRVQVNNNNTIEYIVVEPGLSADGYVEVTPVSGTLTTDMRVVIGYENP